ncbi:MAG: FtsQ-type POTRA domain-containing protein [Magnetococcales bacterium]|nr:FtsQ-type POTRA domain-containing protein [Magnetococcales bacterium]
MFRKLLTTALLAGLCLLAWQGWEMLKLADLFPLQKIHVRGLVNTSRKDAFLAMETPKGTNLLSIDPEKIRSRLLSLPWIHSVQVKRVFPGTLTISLTEKNAACLGRMGERLMVMDEYGKPIKPFEVGDPLLLPVITPLPGPHQAANVVWIVNLLDKHAWIKDRISEAVGQAGGRWDLYTKKGVKLLLSNRGDQELALLHRMQKHYKILDLRVRQIELRIANRVAVRPESGPEALPPEKNEHHRGPTT